jgi:NhaP-type Na+/H+ or K+/H+ antiporter
VIVVRRRITDSALETVAALITPYVAYLLGETLGVSGVTARRASPGTWTAGVLAGDLVGVRAGPSAPMRR